MGGVLKALHLTALATTMFFFGMGVPGIALALTLAGKPANNAYGKIAQPLSYLNRYI